MARLCRERAYGCEAISANAAGPGSRRRVASGWWPPRRTRCGPSTLEFGTTSDGRTLIPCDVTDEFTREALAAEVGRCFDADAAVAALDRLAAERGAPQFLRSNNGLELTGRGA